MIVGFDATTLTGRISGVGYYTARLMESLANGAGEGIVLHDQDNGNGAATHCVTSSVCRGRHGRVVAEAEQINFASAAVHAMAIFEPTFYEVDQQQSWRQAVPAG